MSRQWTINDFQREFKEEKNWTISTYTAGVKLKGNAVSIEISLENCEPNDHAEYIANTANRHINWIVANIEMILDHVAEKMISLANDWLREGESEMTAEDVRNRISLEQINISATGEFDAKIPIEDGNLTLYFSDDDIFGGHTIEVWVNEGYELDDDPTLMG